MSLIALRDLTKRYPRGVVALDGLSLELEPGIIGLVGARSTIVALCLSTWLAFGRRAATPSVSMNDSATRRADRGASVASPFG